MTLIKTLKENKNIRKIFGKREIEIIEKQLNGIRLMPSEQTRISRDIRKKLEAIKELSKYSDEFQLKKGTIIKERIENVKEIILESKYSSKIQKIILFGSAIENELNYRSDIDMAIVFSGIAKKEADEFRIKTLGKISEKVDVQVYNFLPEEIKEQIDKKGKVIWKKE
jgi:predicted nucleotidyltransferase